MGLEQRAKEGPKMTPVSGLGDLWPGLPCTQIWIAGREAGFSGRLKMSGLELDSAKIHGAVGLVRSYLKYAHNAKGNQQNSTPLGV